MKARAKDSRLSLASVGSTATRTGRSGAFKLANAASQIGGGSFFVCKMLWYKADITIVLNHVSSRG